MKCKNCDGTGIVPYRDGNGNIVKEMGLFECPFCNKGEIKVTNEQWLRLCTTEQLAEFLLKISEIDDAPIPCGDLMECSKNCGLYSQCAGDDVMPTNEEIWLEWLKQLHTESSSNP